MKYGTLVLLVHFVMLTGCAKAVPLKAAYCSTIAVSGRAEELKLTHLLEKFTQENGFSLPDGQQVDTNEYENTSKKALIDLTYGMGRFGTVITMFYEGRRADPIKVQLDAYVRNRISSVYKVTKCSDIPGFEVPELTDEPR